MKRFTILVLLCALTACAQQKKSETATTSEMPDRVLVFSKTAGFRHESIETGIALIQRLGAEHNFEVTATEDASVFNDDDLKNITLVLFMSTTEDILNSTQELAFQRYIRSGGNFMGIHAATDTEFDWPWFGELVGAYFENHPEQQQATIRVTNHEHPATAHLEDTWVRFDEWYNYKNLQPGIQVLLELDETSYKGGTNGNVHPIAWYREFEGARMFYTGGGHTKESYAEPAFVQHVLGGILYCLGRKE